MGPFINYIRQISGFLNQSERFDESEHFDQSEISDQPVNIKDIMFFDQFESVPPENEPKQHSELSRREQC